MPLLFAEVVDKVEDGFAAAAVFAALAAFVGLAIGRMAPRWVVGSALSVVVALGAMAIGIELRGPEDAIRAAIRLEVGAWGVVKDVASFHLAWVGPLGGLIAGACARPTRGDDAD
jgi:hypothetical protein